MTCAMDIVNSLIKRAGAGVITVFLLLFCSGLSWGDTTVYVYQAKDTGALKVKTVDSDGLINKNISQTPPGIPDSCYMPDLFWDTAAGALRLNGFDSANDPSWTGTIDKDGMFASSMTLLPTVDCSSVTPAVQSSVVSGIFPIAIPCTSYGAYGACSSGFMARTATPAVCVDPLRSIPCPITVTPCTWQYGGWIPSDSSCTPGQPQFKTATGSPEGCIGAPTQETVKLCGPKTCTDGWQYGAWTPSDAACTPGNTQSRSAIAGTGSIPTGCTGGTTPSDQTKTCVANPCTGGWQYTDWTPSDAACTSGQTQSRSAIAGTGTTPTGCTGGTLPNDQTKTCPSAGGGTYQPLALNCQTGTPTAITTGTYLYSFTVPKGAYTSVFVAYQQAVSGKWSEQVVIKKDGSVTLNDYNTLMAQLTANPDLNSLISSGTGDLWYRLKRAGDTMGSTIHLQNSPADGVISRVNNITTFSRAVPFTMVLRAGDVGPNTVPANSTHKIRYCYIPAPL